MIVQATPAQVVIQRPIEHVKCDRCGTIRETTQQQNEALRRDEGQQVYLATEVGADRDGWSQLGLAIHHKFNPKESKP